MKYSGFMEKFFNKSFLDENIKLTKVLEFLDDRKIDVLFVQNVTSIFCSNFIKKSKNYRIIRGAKSII